MSELRTLVGRGWEQHADDPRGVADRLGPALSLVQEDADVLALAGLAHHVFGEHLAAWDEGRALLARLAALGRHGEPGAGSLRRCDASLAIGAGGEVEPLIGGLGPSDQVRVLAMAGAGLVPHDVARASELFERALEVATRAALPDDDPMHRALAVTAHNLACSLEEKAARNSGETRLMLAAARASRTHWEKAGTWLEVERAEYRLAMSWLAAGDAPTALRHAELCLQAIDANGRVPLELFFGLEARARAQRELGDEAGFVASVDQARSAFAALDEGDQSWCRPTLAALDGMR